MSQGGAPRRRPLTAWFSAHRRAARDGWQHLSEHALATLLAIAVLAVAISLPGLLGALLDKHRELTRQWQATPALTAFMVPGLSLEETHDLARELRADEAVRGITVHAADAAYRELLAASGLGGSGGSTRNGPGSSGGETTDNPLPHVLSVKPAAAAVDARRQLADVLARDERVDAVLADSDWTTRLAAIERLAARAVLLLGIVLGGGALLIVTNTIRVQIQQRREELVVLRLVGATDTYIRRPFLYSGLVHGGSAGVLACLVIGAVFVGLSGPVQSLAASYGSQFSLGWPSLRVLSLVLGGSIAMGWFGAWLGAWTALKRLEGGSLTH